MAISAATEEDVDILKEEMMKLKEEVEKLKI